MAYHYLGDIQHVTCQTASGQRRSPLSDISYNSGQELKDEYTGRVHHRQHTDGTDIVATDIVSADTSCPYGDTSVSSARRREQMYNELYQLNTVNSERIYWKTTIALPNMFDDEQTIIITNEIAMSFSQYFGRPVDYSVHRKPATAKRPKNIHIHVALSERKFVRGKWGAKSVSYYVNKDDTLNTQKHYKDENGNDTRKPRTINNENPVYAIDENGHEYCVNQLRDSNGRRKWKMQNVEGLTREDVSWMHEEIDRIQDRYLKEVGLEPVKRNDRRTTQELKDLGVKAVHIGKRDNEAKGENYREKVAINEQYKRIANSMNNSYAKLDTAVRELKDTERAEAEAKEQLDSAMKNAEKVDAELQQEKELTEQATKAYVEETLQPEENYIKRAEEEYKKALALVDKNIAMIQSIADEKIDAIDNALLAYANISNKTDKEKLINQFLQTNRQHWKTYRNAIDKIENPTITSVKKLARKQWYRCPGWKRCEYIRQTAGNDSAYVYKQYLSLKGDSVKKPKDNTPLKVVTCEEVVADVMKSIPSLQSQVDRNKSAIENAEAITAEVRGAEQTHGKAELFLPPMNGDALALWASIPDRMVTMMEEKQSNVIRPLQDYLPARDRFIFETKLHALEKRLSENNVGNTKAESGNTDTTTTDKTNEDLVAKHRADYDKSAKMRDALLTKLREETAKAYADYTYKKESNLYDQYLQDKEPFDICAENLEAMKQDTPTNYAEIQRTQKRYDKLLAKLKERYPGHPLREPDITVNQAEAASMFKEYRADLVKRKIQELHLPVSKELIKAYDTEAKNAQNLWQFVKADKAQNNQQSDKKQTADNSKQLDQKPKIKSKDKGSDKSKPDNTR